jgi:hypothetical protein
METSDFMHQLERQLMDERKVAESTANAYIKTLYQLNNKAPFKNLAFLKNTEAIDAKLGSYAESTQRAILATIVSVLTPYKAKPTFKKVYQYFYDKMMNKNGDAKKSAEENKGVMTEKQKDNWISWEDIQKIKTEKKDAVDKFANNKTLTAGEYDTLLQYVILSLYTEVQPRRNQDYLDMYFVKKYNDKMENDKNYYDMATHKFIYNKYKTAKKWGTQTADVPESLQGVIATYLKHHPLYKGTAKRKNEAIKFLVNMDGTGITAVNAITRLLNRVFGKKVGSSMLRHIYISDKYKDVMEEQEKDAEAMGHSVSQQRDYFKKE